MYKLVLGHVQQKTLLLKGQEVAVAESFWEVDVTIL